ncbi:hypothetical protein WN51_14694 [Melipona quadrifasciata]|uniref:Uncharacterized protein n=1 Tax=Melipona quadrifasciata TaxID=166423 RepID=A0A0M9A1Z2_9HYME|nr:hypothetical protein WN51_14694 [Melipona quadrifasciata]
MARAPARLHLAEPYALRRNVASSLIAAPEAPKTKTQRSCRCAPIERNVAIDHSDEVVRGISIWLPKLCITAGRGDRRSREKVGFTAVVRGQVKGRKNGRNVRRVVTGAAEGGQSTIHFRRSARRPLGASLPLDRGQ